MKSHPLKTSRQQTHSIARPKVFTAAEQPIPKDKRNPSLGNGKQGFTTCPVCGTDQSTFKASLNTFTRQELNAIGVSPGDPLIRRHTPEGGRVRVGKGDVRCKGSETRVDY